jgi:hypothetical protein
MGKVIDGGVYEPGDEIPQPFSIVTGANLRKPDSEKPAGPDRPQDAEVEPAEANAKGRGLRRPGRRRRKS